MRTGRIITALATMLALPVMAADAPGYFKVPGTDTTLKIYGKAETWGYYTMDGGPDFHDFADYDENPHADPILVPVNEDWAKKNTTDSITYGRLGITTLTPSSFGDVKVNLEFDMRSKSGKDSWNSDFRMRHAYGEFGGLLVGQTNSLWVDWQYCTGYNDTWLEDFNGTQYRTRQIRYTFNPADNFKVGISMEQDKSGGNTTKFGPAFLAAAKYSGDWGFVCGIVGYQKYEKGSFDVDTVKWSYKSDTGISWSLGGAWNITENDQIGGKIVNGGGQHGFSSYTLSDGFYKRLDNSKLDFYKSTSIDLGYSHTWNDSFNTNLGIGQIRFDKENNLLVGDSSYNLYTDVKINEFFINTNWNITKNATFGVEYYDSTIKGDDEIFLGRNDDWTKKAHYNGFNVMFQYRFF